MASIQTRVAFLSSVALRVFGYVFLRWIPGHHFVPLIYTLFSVYVPSFIASFFTQPQYNVLADNVKITLVEVEVEDSSPTSNSTAALDRNLNKTTGSTHIEEEIDVEETVLLERKTPKILRTLLTGLPSPTSTLLSLLTFLMNVLLVLAVTDLVYTAKFYHASEDLSFARIGYVSDKEAKLLIREPDKSKLPITVHLRIHDPKPPYDNPAWIPAGGISFLQNTTDFTAVVPVKLNGVLETVYDWKTSNGHSGIFTSAPRPGYKTSKNGGVFTFLTSSCIIPHFPYNPMDHPLSILGFKHLANLLPSLGAQFMLFLGDFIYADVPLTFGSSVEDFRRDYRQVYASPDWPAVGQNLSWIHVLDDHEISNDFDNNMNGTIDPLYKAAADPWHHYQAAANPPQARAAGTYNEVRKDATYFEFTQGPATFFMMDTRKYRDKIYGLPPNSTVKTMLGEKQLADLLAFLGRPVPKGVKWKIVASSVPFTKNWQVNGLDTWAGYLGERSKILEAMWDVGLRGGVGVVILSGDRHEFAATAFPPPFGGRWPVSATVHEFSTSPLSQFYLPIPTYRQTDEEDIMIQYIPQGNSKFGAISIDNLETGDQSVLKFRLFIDGKEAWSSVLLSPPAVQGKMWGKDALWG